MEGVPRSGARSAPGLAGLVGTIVGCLIAIVRRGSQTLIPSGQMELEFGDRLTVIGEIDGIEELKQRFTSSPSAG